MRGKGVLLLKVLVLTVALSVAAGCTTELHSLRGANQQLVAERESLSKEITDLKSQLAESDQQKAELQNQIKKLQAEVDYWKGQSEAYSDAIDKYRAIGAPGVGEGVMRQVAEDMGAVYLEGGGVRLASDVLFDSGKASLKAEAVAALEKAATAFLSGQGANLHLRIDGHTDNQPIKFSNWKDNMELSQARARAVWLELTKRGVAPERMFTAGFGECAPITENATPEGRAQNRRVEIWLVPPPAAAQLSE